MDTANQGLAPWLFKVFPALDFDTSCGEGIWRLSGSSRSLKQGIRVDVLLAGDACLARTVPEASVGNGRKTGSNGILALRTGKQGKSEDLENLVGKGGGAGRVRTAASQFCRLLP